MRKDKGKGRLQVPAYGAGTNRHLFPNPGRVHHASFVLKSAGLGEEELDTADVAVPRTATGKAPVLANLAGFS